MHTDSMYTAYFFYKYFRNIDNVGAAGETGAYWDSGTGAKRWRTLHQGVEPPND